MNPCPCGYLGDNSGRCRCTLDQIGRYRGRISGPLLDRIDMHVEVPRLDLSRIVEPMSEDKQTTAVVRRRVDAARERQVARAGKPNHVLGPAEIARDCALEIAGQRMIEQAIDRLALSARAYHRILKVARTIADLDGLERIEQRHLGEAIGYRRLDRGNPANGQV
jgi:magnesium chelatase family protein